MQLLLIVLNKIELLDTLLGKFMDNGIQGATIFSSTGMVKELQNLVRITQSSEPSDTLSIQIGRKARLYSLFWKMSKLKKQRDCPTSCWWHIKAWYCCNVHPTCSFYRRSWVLTMQLNMLFYLALVLFSGLIFGRLVKLIKLPNVTGYLIAGLLIGPYLLNLVTSGDKSVRINIWNGTSFYCFFNRFRV